VFTFDDGLLAEVLWKELSEAKRDNILLACELKVAESAVAELSAQVQSLMDQINASESETDDVKGD
jgi:hypothetical protein|tara:strand:+ start:631 stop:828 length:198 start_codon:yes stop_codon:yes gene_type:complete